MNVRELIEEMTKIEDQTLPVMTSDVDYGWDEVYDVLYVAEHKRPGEFGEVVPAFIGLK